MYNFPDLNSIKIKRKKLGLTQQKVAKDCLISQSLLAKVELGEVTPSYKIAKILFEYLEALENSDSKKAYQIMNKKLIILNGETPISKAINTAIRYGISQFPVKVNNSILGSITTINMLDADKKARVINYISPALPTVSRETPVKAIKELLKSTAAILVLDSGKPVGIITAEELL